MSFEPYIHGTSSAIFSLLSKTQFQLLSPLKMAKGYKAVPPCGEYVGGGYAVLGSSTIDKEDMGATSFAKLSTKDPNGYPLEKVISSYSKLSAWQIDSAIKQFKEQAEKAQKMKSSNINLLIIFYAQIRQLGSHTQVEEIADDVKELQEIFSATLQFYYFLQLLSTRLTPNKVVVDRLIQDLGQREFEGFIEKYFTIERVIGRIKKSPINFKEIIDNPTEENLKKVIKFLEIEEHDNQQNISLFSITEKVDDSCLEKSRGEFFEELEEYYRNSFLEMGKGGYHCSSLASFEYKLYSWLGGTKGTQFSLLRKFINEYLDVVQERITVFNHLVTATDEEIAFNNEQKACLENVYPIILINEKGSKLPIDENYQEYRSIEPQIIGEDITLLATDTREHQIDLMRYVQKHQLNVDVILFDELKDARDSKVRPKTITLQDAEKLLEQTRRLQQLIDNKLGANSAYINRFFINRSKERDRAIQDIKNFSLKENNPDRLINYIKNQANAAQQHHETTSGFRLFGFSCLLFNKTCGFKQTVHEIINEYEQTI